MYLQRLHGRPAWQVRRQGVPLIPQPLSVGYLIETVAPAETEALGALAAVPGTVVALRGELGAGKTVFVRGLASGLLGPSTVAVTSPTYVLQHIYRSGTGVLYHLDLYRLKGGTGEFEASGLYECLADPRGVVCLEWPERAEALLPSDRLEVELEHQGATRRLLRIKATGPASARIVDVMILRAGTRDRLLAWMAQGGLPYVQTPHPLSWS